MKFINLTSQDLIFRNNKTIEQNGNVAWVHFNESSQLINGIEVRFRIESLITGLPEPEQETLYIVPRVVFLAAEDRDDLLFPIYSQQQGQVKFLIGKESKS